MTSGDLLIMEQPGVQINSSPGWAARTRFGCVVTPDGSIVLMGGNSGSGYKNDVWRSTDNGYSWSQVKANAEWSARNGPWSVVMPDGSIVLLGRSK